MKIIKIVKHIIIFGSTMNLMENVKFALKKGDQILYRSGPRTTRQVILIDGGLQKFLTILPQSTEWSTLNFSNPSLPEKFEVMLIDAGTGWGEWIAVGFKEK